MSSSVREAAAEPRADGGTELARRISDVETSGTVMLKAMDLASDHGLTIRDSVILAASAEGGCRLLLTQDLQEGFTWRGVTVTNPFAPVLHPLLASLLAPPEG